MSRDPVSAASVSRPASTQLPPPGQLARLRADLWEAVCSAAWFDDSLTAALRSGLRLKRSLPRELDRLGLYPPGGSCRNPAHPRGRTLMRRCVTCGGAWYPPQYVRRDGRCEDCHAAAELPPALAATDAATHRPSTCSPSAIAIRQLEHYGIRLVEPRLPAEDIATLRQQAARYLKMQPTGKRITVNFGDKP